jgi:hypothetical protein
MERFFTPPPPPEPEPERDIRERPPWFGPPFGVLPGVVPVERVIARTDELAFAVGRIAAYPTGFECQTRVVPAAPSYDDDADPMRPFRPRGGELPPELLRFGLRFSDGTKATSTQMWLSRDDPEGPVLMPRGGGGGGGEWEQEWWVWPLPPPGPLAFVCEWPARGIALTSVEIDAQPILDAAARARELFPQSS